MTSRGTKEWFEMKDVTRARLAAGVWIPLYVSDETGDSTSAILIIGLTITAFARSRCCARTGYRQRPLIGREQPIHTGLTRTAKSITPPKRFFPPTRSQLEFI